MEFPRKHNKGREKILMRNIAWSVAVLVMASVFVLLLVDACASFRHTRLSVEFVAPLVLALFVMAFSVNVFRLWRNPDIAIFILVTKYGCFPTSNAEGTLDSAEFCLGGKDVPKGFLINLWGILVAAEFARDTKGRWTYRPVDNQRARHKCIGELPIAEFIDDFIRKRDSYIAFLEEARENFASEQSYAATLDVWRKYGMSILINCDLERTGRGGRAKTLGDRPRLEMRSCARKEIE